MQLPSGDPFNRRSSITGALRRADSEFQVAQARAEALQRAYQAGVVAAIDMKEAQIRERDAELLKTLTARRSQAFAENVSGQRAAADARIQQAVRRVDIAQRTVDGLRIVAPIGGVVQQVLVEPGKQIEKGAAVAQMLMQGDLITRLSVPENLAKNIRLGLPVEVDTRVGTFKGRIVRIDPTIRDNAVVVDVDAQNGQRLPESARPDLSVTAKIIGDRIDGVITIRRPALASDGGVLEMFVLDESGTRATRRKIIFGRASSDRIEVLSGMIKGEKVILSDTSAWTGSDVLSIK